MQSLSLDDEWTCRTDSPNVAMLYRKWESSYDVEAKPGQYQRTLTFSHKFIAHDISAIKPVKVVIDGLVGDYGWCKSTIDMPVGGDRAHFTWPHSIKILVNGKPATIQFDFTPRYLDAYWPIIDISDKLVDGENEIKMVCNTHNEGTFHLITDPWRIIGNFEVDESGGIPNLSKARTKVLLGDLTAQGFLRYHGGFSYLQDIAIPSKYVGNRFKLHVANTTDCVEVNVNGNPCGVCWNHWDVDVTSHVKPGEKNTIELVYYGIAQNVLQTNAVAQGLRGPIILEILDKE